MGAKSDHMLVKVCIPIYIKGVALAMDKEEKCSEKTKKIEDDENEKIKVEIEMKHQKLSKKNPIQKEPNAETNIENTKVTKFLPNNVEVNPIQEPNTKPNENNNAIAGKLLEYQNQTQNQINQLKDTFSEFMKKFIKQEDSKNIPVPPKPEIKIIPAPLKEEPKNKPVPPKQDNSNIDVISELKKQIEALTNKVNEQDKELKDKSDWVQRFKETSSSTRSHNDLMKNKLIKMLDDNVNS
jgi:hypothetical protein